MAENSAFPQIPTTVWWGVRSLLNKTPRAVISEDFLGVELSVQPAAARQYVTELKRVGLLSEDNKATELAHRWRMPDSYQEAVEAILTSAYDESLLTVAPTTAERAKAVDWFMRKGLGEGAARNKAATYFLIASAEPGESPPKTTAASPRARPQNATGERVVKEATPARRVVEERGTPREGGIFPVNLNLQIHISADATVDQIDAIFSSMRKHLGNAQLS